jgi:hypothetical protein
MMPPDKAREPRQFLHDALPRAHLYLERFDHRVLNQPPNPVRRDAGRSRKSLL